MKRTGTARKLGRDGPGPSVQLRLFISVVFCRGTAFTSARFPNQVLRVCGALADSVFLHSSLGICLSLQIAECGRVRGRLCLILISPALARCNRQTSDQNQLVFSHVALAPSLHRGTVALYGEASRKGFRVWLSYIPDWFKKWRRKWRNSYLENLTSLI
jgi:hypothetical protein